MAGYIIPNAGDATFLDQSEPDSGDFIALGNRKSGVISGCIVSANSNQTVAVSAGEVISDGTFHAITANPSFTMGLGSAGAARFDLVVINSSGAITKRDGSLQSGSNPTFPPLSDGDVLLAAVYRAAGTTDVIISTRIIDKRIITPSSVVRSGALVSPNPPSSGLGNIGDLFVNTSVSSNTGQSQIYVKTTSSLWENIAEYYPIATANTINTLVQRNGSGNFAAGVITATSFVGPLTGAVTGAVTGNASTATAWQTARTVTLSGAVAGTITLDGTTSPAVTTTFGATKVTSTQLDYATTVPQIFVNGTPTGKDGDIWIVT